MPRPSCFLLFRLLFFLQRERILFPSVSALNSFFKRRDHCVKLPVCPFSRSPACLSLSRMPQERVLFFYLSADRTDPLLPFPLAPDRPPLLFVFSRAGNRTLA